jgi:hypothetical protein
MVSLLFHDNFPTGEVRCGLSGPPIRVSGNMN